MPDDERNEVKSYLENVEHVSAVSHDDSENYNRTREEDGKIKTYALYEVLVDVPADSVEANIAYNVIFNHFKQDYTVYESGQVADYNASVIKIQVVLLAIGCAMAILILMSESYIEPFLYLFAILIAVLLNKGTNIIFPSISHVTDGISMVLQMALSMDYAIMLSSRYRQEKKSAEHPDKTTAMRRALQYSFGSICSSSITTVVGLLVLIFMSFTIGRDMGLVLSKGVVLSLFAIFTVLPALLLIFDGAIEKTRKKTLNLNLKWLGVHSFNLRHFALPIFIVIFAGAFLLKGNVNILYTGSENNHVKDIFEEINQTAIIYDNSEEERIAELCKKYEDKPEVERTLCYSNTIGEPEKYDEIIDKANSLSGITISGASATHEATEITTEDYLVKVLYYYYYRGENATTMSLPEFIKFIQNEVADDPHFANELSGSTRADINRLAQFVLPENANRLRSKAELASLLEVDGASLDDLFTLYYSKHPHAVKLTLYQFASFVTNEVLTNPSYSSLVSREAREDLAKLLTFSNPKVTNAKKSASELAALFGLDPTQVEQLFVYYNFTAKTTSTVAITPEELVKFALNDDNVLAELGLTREDVDKVRAQLAELKAKLAEHQSEIDKLKADLDAVLAKHPELAEIVEQEKAHLEAILHGEYTYQDYVNLAAKITTQLEQTKARLAEINEKYELGLDLSKLPEINLTPYLDKLQQVYRLYEAEATASTTKLTPAEFIDFLLAHKDDDRLKSALTSNKVELLKLAQYVIRNQPTLYTAADLAKAFDLDYEQLKLVFALYDYRHINTNPRLSLKTLINFIITEVLPDETYARKLDEDKRAKIYQISSLMAAAEAGTQYNASALYRTLLPLSEGQIDYNQIFLLYLYHGSLYDYDENWALTIEQFVEFLNEEVILDRRFEARIDDEMRDKIIESKTTITDAKNMLVGPKHSRALIESYLPPEGETTFALFKDIENQLGDGKKTKYFVIGDSAMAYEMSQTFNSEMDFITLLTMISIFIVVAFTFKSLLIPLLLVLVIQSAVYLNMAYLSLTGQSIYFIALIIVQAILMGATIDYAILYTSYYLENRNYHKLGIKDALIQSYNKSIHAILTSAGILILVTAIVGNFATAIAAKICQSISGGTLCATLIILLLLPALLATMDKWIVKRKD